MRVASLLILAACSRSPDRSGERVNVPPARSGPINPDSVRSVALDCTAFAPRVACAAMADPAPSASVLVDAASLIPAYLTQHFPPNDRWSVLRAAADAAGAVDPSVLSTRARIVVQNAALRIASYAIENRRFTHEPVAELARAALAVAERFALPPATLDALGDDPDAALATWIGAPSSWRLRDPHDAVEGPPNLHDNVVGLGFAWFEPVVVADGRRALFAQLVAIDTDGAPHVTPVVGLLEARASAALDAPACVAELSLGALACGVPAGLVPADLTHPATNFFQVVDGKLMCNSCHTARDLPIVPAADATRMIAEGKQALLATARDVIAHVRQGE